MKKALLIFLAALILCSCFSACSTDNEAETLAKKAFEVVTLYANNSETEILTKEFKDAAVGKEAFDGWLETNLKYSDYKDKYAEIFDADTLDYFLEFTSKDVDGVLYIPQRNIEKSEEISNVKASFSKTDENGNSVYRLEYDSKDLNPNFASEINSHFNRKITLVKTDGGYRVNILTIMFNAFQNAIA